MKPQNKYRSARANVKLLEQALSLKERLFSMLAVRRGARRLQRWLKLLLLLLPVAALVYYAANYALEKAYGLSIEHISYKSLRGIIQKDQAMRILELRDTVNIATLNTEALKRRLEADPAVRSATVRAELPETLYIEIEERIPIVYAEMESSALTGTRTRLFMDPEGNLFPVNEQYHAQFLGVPTWYLQPGDVRELKTGEQIDPQKIRPITELIAAANAYETDQIPPITEIFHRKDWQLRLILNTGTEVLMEVRHIKEQMERLALILDHARATKRWVRSINVIPSINPTAVFDNEEK